MAVNEKKIAKEAIKLSSKGIKLVPKAKELVKEYERDLTALVKEKKIPKHLENDRSIQAYKQRILEDKEFEATPLEATILAIYCKIFNVLTGKDPFKSSPEAHTFMLAILLALLYTLLDTRYARITLKPKSVRVIVDTIVTTPITAALLFMTSEVIVYFRASFANLSVSKLILLLVIVVLIAGITSALTGVSKQYPRTNKLLVGPLILSIVAAIANKVLKKKSTLLEKLRSGSLKHVRQALILILSIIIAVAATLTEYFENEGAG